MRKPKPPSIITVAIITTITIIFWIFFDVYKILTREAEVDVPEQLLKPVNPTLNREILSSLKGKIDYQKDSVIHFSTDNKIEIPVSIEEAAVPTIISTEIPNIDSSTQNQATQSGEFLQ